jgi:dihydrofolate reductase
MAKLIYSSIASLDGYIADENGNFDWAEPDEEMHTLVNDLARPVGTFLLGRRMYEVLVAWETLDTADQLPYIQDFAEIWRAAEKVVYSTTLETVSKAVRQLKTTAERDLIVGGPGLAAHAIRAGLVDEWQVLLVPVIVGGGIRFFPDDVRLTLELLDERRFGNGTLHLRYRTIA